MQVSRETSYADLQKLVLKEMAPILHDDILTSSQSSEVSTLSNLNNPNLFQKDNTSYKFQLLLVIFKRSRYVCAIRSTNYNVT